MRDIHISFQLLFVLAIGILHIEDSKAQTLEINCPNDLTVNVEDFGELPGGVSEDDLVVAAFEDWFSFFSFTDNGCNPVASGLEDIEIPKAGLGGTVKITYVVTDDCGNAETCTSSFVVIGSVMTPIIVSCPPDVNLSNSYTQAQVDSAFVVWIGSFLSIPDYGLTTDLDTFVSPLIGSDPVIVDFVSRDPNNEDNIGTCLSTFFPPASSLVNPNDEIPTMGQWGVIVLLILLMIFGTTTIRSIDPLELSPS